ncbi:MAG: hypothetical protein QNJ53_00375 [Pleurocapsa sp. MO_192.B19]|nr:hypothetical protein [Pleurocapsa sp. MO_192.B19]
MGRNKHYKLGKTKRVFIPEAIADEVLELVKMLDEIDNPQKAIAHFKATIKYVKEINSSSVIKKK